MSLNLSPAVGFLSGWYFIASFLQQQHAVMLIHFFHLQYFWLLAAPFLCYLQLLLASSSYSWLLSATSGYFQLLLATFSYLRDTCSYFWLLVEPFGRLLIMFFVWLLECT
jgi:hypothetical protein